MTAPRLEIDLGKIHDNACNLVKTLGRQGIRVTGVTKAGLGRADIANVLLQAGVHGLGDSRIENIEALREAGVTSPISLIRSPMLSHTDQVVRHADVSFNTELDVVNGLSLAARRASRRHGVVLMVELGDLREGILPNDVEESARRVRRLPNIDLVGIGTNLACRSGVVPDKRNMAVLSSLANSLEAALGHTLSIVSGGNSANLQWAVNTEEVGRVNDLRLGESILLGQEPLHRKPIPGLHTDAITLVAEVIESKLKPSMPTGSRAQSAFGEPPAPDDRGSVAQSILALGRQDVDPADLRAPAGIRILDASSDHLMVASDHRMRIGTELDFGLEYGALLRAMTSPFVSKVITGEYSRRAGGPRTIDRTGCAAQIRSTTRSRRIEAG